MSLLKTAFILATVGLALVGIATTLASERKGTSAPTGSLSSGAASGSAQPFLGSASAFPDATRNSAKS